MTDIADVGTWRDLNTGTNPLWFDPEWADGANDQPGDPGGPIPTRLDGPWGLPWWDGFEDPNWQSMLESYVTPMPTTDPNPTIGEKPLPGAFEGAFRTLGPVQAWGLEPSGGLEGDQAIGRIMRFPANIPDRYDPNGVWNVDYRDELAAVIEFNGQGYVQDEVVTTSLVQWPNVGMH